MCFTSTIVRAGLLALAALATPSLAQTSAPSPGAAVPPYLAPGAIVLPPSETTGSGIRDRGFEPSGMDTSLLLHDRAVSRGGLIAFLQEWSAVAWQTREVLERYLVAKAAKGAPCFPPIRPAQRQTSSRTSTNWNGLPGGLIGEEDVGYEPEYQADEGDVQNQAVKKQKASDAVASNSRS